jgi:hypothetical protein
MKKTKSGKAKKPNSPLDVQPSETIMVQPEVVIDMNKNDYVVDDSQH